MSNSFQTVISKSSCSDPIIRFLRPFGLFKGPVLILYLFNQFIRDPWFICNFDFESFLWACQLYQRFNFIE